MFSTLYRSFLSCVLLGILFVFAIPNAWASAGVYGHPCYVQQRFYPQGVIQPGDNKTVLRRGNNRDPMTLDFQKVNGAAGEQIAFDLGEGLMSLRSPDGAVVYGAADECWVSNDGLVYTFHIRENAKWSNGDSIVAPDFVNAVYRVIDPKTKATYASFFYGLRNATKINQGIAGQYKFNLLGVKALSPKWIQFHLSYPVPYFLHILALPPSFPIHISNYIMSRSDDPEVAEGFTKPERFITDGPYMLEENIPNDHITVVKNPYYWDKKHVRINKIIYYPYDPSKEVDQFLKGNLDWTFEIASNLYDKMRNRDKKENKTELIRLPYLGIYYYVFNFDLRLNHGVSVQEGDVNYDNRSNFAPFSNTGSSEARKAGEMMRQALTMAVDREALHKVLEGGGYPLFSYVPKGVNGVDIQTFGWENLSPQDRNAKARSLFEKAMSIYRKEGYIAKGAPFHLTIKYYDDETYNTVAKTVAKMWSDVFGKEISVDTLHLSWDDVFSDARNGRFSVLGMGWVGDYNYVDSFLTSFLPNDSNNYGRYNSSLYSIYYHNALHTPDFVQRRNLMTSALNVLLEDYPAIPLYQYSTDHLVKCNLRGYIPMDYKKVTSEKLDTNLLDFTRSADFWFADPATSERCHRYIDELD